MDATLIVGHEVGGGREEDGYNIDLAEGRGDLS